MEDQFKIQSGDFITVEIDERTKYVLVSIRRPVAYLIDKKFSSRSEFFKYTNSINENKSDVPIQLICLNESGVRRILELILSFAGLGFRIKRSLSNDKIKICEVL